ncbi:hypothetical protein MMC21_000625 [Puttea exsequens]|nr:hypothetical protein [Puttea exsequens]
MTETDLALGIAARGPNNNSILQESYSPSTWQPDRTAYLNVQILSSEAFQQVSVTTYASQGLPFPQIYKKHSAIKDEPVDVKFVESPNEAGTRESSTKRAGEEHGEPPYKDPIITLNSNGSRTPFCLLVELEKELCCMNANAQSPWYKDGISSQI